MTEEKLLEMIDRGNTKHTEAKRWWTLDPVDGTLGILLLLLLHIDWHRIPFSRVHRR